MTPNEYQKEALRTEQPKNKPVYVVESASRRRLLNGLMGLNGEAGEAIEIFKKYLFQGHPLNREHLAMELGDVAWYLAVSADALGYTLEDIFQMNIAKRRDRYPDGFEAERSVNRKEEDV